MDTALLIGTSSMHLGMRVAEMLDLDPVLRSVERFPDGELRVEIEESVRERDVYIFQSTGPMVDTNLMELMLLADAARRAGAGRITAIIPYFGYARQDRRAHGREPLSARLVADLLQTAGVQRVLCVDLHNRGLEGVFGVPLEQLSAVDLLAERVRRLAIPRSVVVAPDFGAAGRAEQVARKLGRPMAVIHKTRLQGGGVRAESITGDVLAMAPIIVDDMVVSGATIEAAVQVLLGAGAQAHITIVASHGVFALGCAGRLNRLPIQQIVVTDTLTPSAVLEVGLSVESVDSMLADAITRLHCAYPMADLVGQA